ncbi:MAG: tRNA uridine-5-carboxymethylaminomethyl(34) synthesis enzyme MnmG [Candidatus Improbicoccus pseudotrichonymphae]|uniref:tRNA uridine 5-carboxymethylaminomethyl modification enzyme MnmG n=1 Tax=Candidatus Improbicoccus pseudotrichonymphae TaxID=3033792 RepID=A0AA48KZ93_9FIRM|nr:MAG: tRNA uridine-5-carboxymethylaminomethyl(34) synthesis enzyme MnmG [Candidatus Improbicoccus pseudotrichonymphae]
MNNLENYYDVIVIGAGHAGIEAALASSRLGARTAVFTINLSSVGNCPCSPSVGGMAKGTLVREVDALGGEMAKISDQCFIHSKILGIGKGAATHSLRVQVDRDKYRIIAKHILEMQPNLYLREAQIVSTVRKEFWEVCTRSGITYKSKCLILACGTYLDAKIHIGLESFKSGPDGIFPASFLSKALQKLNVKMKRFKTGTPARILKSSIDFSCLEVQEGDEKITPFSYTNMNKNIGKNSAICHIAWTNKETKRIISENIQKSAMYSGNIEGVGPRYCPSIEDKIVRFPQKERHQIFVEPCGLQTDEIYLHGTSSSLPEDVQVKFYRSIKGFEKAILMRPAYAIEYDIIDPVQLKRSLEFKDFPGLFSAGQMNGTSGYEEAAAQGIIAGINAAAKVLNKKPVVLDRSNSYIGTLIDDLIFKGVSDPYRMMTSRSEYRLLLRFDNANERLTPIGRKIGLIKDDYWHDFKERLEKKEYVIKKLKNFSIKPFNYEGISTEKFIRAFDLLKRPEINYEKIKIIDQKLSKELSEIPEEIINNVEILIKYEGYIRKQTQDIQKAERVKKNKIPENIVYSDIKNLSFEAREKLARFKPENILEASKISGVNPSDIAVLSVHIKKFKVI